MKLVHLGLVAMVVTGCGDGDASASASGSEDQALGPHSALYDCVETNFEEVHPLAGPGYDPESGLAEPSQSEYFVSTTMLYWKPGKKDQFYSVGGKVMAQVDTSDGLVAWALGVDEDCRAARSITVWQSEEDMYEFVVSGAHGEATSMIHDLSDTGRATRWWTSPEAIETIDWDMARSKLNGAPESHVYDR